MWMRSDCRSIRPSRFVYADAGRRHGERRVLNRDGAGRVRIGGRAGHVDLRLQHPGHVGQRGREPLHDPEIDRAAVDVEIDAILRRHRASWPERGVCR